MNMKFCIALLICVSPTVALAPDLCYIPKNSCDGCGSGGSLFVCDFTYDGTTSGGRKWGAGVASPVICKEYPASSHTTTPCAEDPPPGYKRTTCGDIGGGDCCDIHQSVAPTITTSGTITKPNGHHCPIGS